MRNWPLVSMTVFLGCAFNPLEPVPCKQPVPAVVRVCGHGAFGEIALPRKFLGEVSFGRTTGCGPRTYCEVRQPVPCLAGPLRRTLTRWSLSLVNSLSLRWSVPADMALSEKSPYLGSSWVR